MKIRKIKEYEYKVTSKQEIYTIYQRKDKTWWCNCKSFMFQTKECKHINAVIQWQDAQRNTKHSVVFTTEELNILQHKLSKTDGIGVENNLWVRLNIILNGRM